MKIGKINPGCLRIQAKVPPVFEGLAVVERRRISADLQIRPTTSSRIRVAARNKHFTMERKDILALLARRMAKLPTVSKKVLAMHYYENMRPLDIANSLGLAESRIRQIHLQAVTSLKTLFYSIKS